MAERDQRPGWFSKYVFYRAVALTPANYSRILIATCRLGPDGQISTERLDRAALERHRRLDERV